MWRTPLGDRVLRGAEGTLFQQALLGLLVWLDESEGEQQVGVRRFDTLSLPERVAALEQAASALLLAEVSVPEPTAVLEAAAAAVYAHLIEDVEVEIDMGADESRQLVRAAAAAHHFLDDDAPDLQWDDLESWRDLIERIMDTVFWDHDWDDELVKLDDPPDLANEIREGVRISDDYYTAVPQDPTPQQLVAIRERLKMLCKMPLS